MRQIRLEAYGEDIGQHSWVSAAELRADAHSLKLSQTTRLLDLGSGPCGPITFLIVQSGCSGVAVELSPSAIGAGQTRATALAVQDRFSGVVADLNDPLPEELGLFDAALAIDVVLHLRDRLALYRQLRQRVAPGGRVLITDAGVVTGSISSDEVRLAAGRASWIETTPSLRHSSREPHRAKLVHNHVHV